jgi:hypothetical protein
LSSLVLVLSRSRWASVGIPSAWDQIPPTWDRPREYYWSLYYKPVFQCVYMYCTQHTSRATPILRVSRTPHSDLHSQLTDFLISYQPHFLPRILEVDLCLSQLLALLLSSSSALGSRVSVPLLLLILTSTFAGRSLPSTACCLLEIPSSSRFAAAAGGLRSCPSLRDGRSTDSGRVLESTLCDSERLELAGEVRSS